MHGLTILNMITYRIDPMEVVSGTLEREKVHYQAPAADAVLAEMKQFLDWFNADSTPKDYVKSAVAHFWFVSIHPFDEPRRVRDVSYGISISADRILVPGPRDE